MIALYHHRLLILLNDLPVSIIHILCIANPIPCKAPQIIKFQLAPCQNPPSNIVVSRFILVAIPFFSLPIMAGMMNNSRIPTHRPIDTYQFQPNNDFAASNTPPKKRIEKNQVPKELFLLPPNGIYK